MNSRRKSSFNTDVSVQIGRIEGNDYSKKAVCLKIVDQANLQVCKSGVSFSRKTHNRSSILSHSKLFPRSLQESHFIPEEMLHLLHKVQVVILNFFSQSKELQNAFDLQENPLVSYDIQGIRQT